MEFFSISQAAAALSIRPQALRARVEIQALLTAIAEGSIETVKLPGRGSPVGIPLTAFPADVQAALQQQLEETSDGLGTAATGEQSAAKTAWAVGDGGGGCSAEAVRQLRKAAVPHEIRDDSPLPQTAEKAASTQRGSNSAANVPHEDSPTRSLSQPDVSANRVGSRSVIPALIAPRTEGSDKRTRTERTIDPKLELLSSLDDFVEQCIARKRAEGERNTARPCQLEWHALLLAGKVEGLSSEAWDWVWKGRGNEIWGIWRDVLGLVSGRGFGRFFGGGVRRGDFQDK